MYFEMCFSQYVTKSYLSYVNVVHELNEQASYSGYIDGVDNDIHVQ